MIKTSHEVRSTLKLFLSYFRKTVRLRDFSCKENNNILILRFMLKSMRNSIKQEITQKLKYSYIGTEDLWHVIILLSFILSRIQKSKIRKVKLICYTMMDKVPQDLQPHGTAYKMLIGLHLYRVTKQIKIKYKTKCKTAV